MDNKPPPYSPSQDVQQHPSAPHPTAPYPQYPPGNPPYPVGHSNFPQPHQMVHQPQAYSYPPPQPTVNTTNVIVSGGALPPGICPVCRNGSVEREFTCCGICCGIFFFPIGLICCFCMRETKCTVCRASF